MFTYKYIYIYMHKYNAIPGHIFVPLNWYSHTSIESNIFGVMFVKRPYTRLESAFWTNQDIVNSK